MQLLRCIMIFCFFCFEFFWFLFFHFHVALFCRINFTHGFLVYQANYKVFNSSVDIISSNCYLYCCSRVFIPTKNTLGLQMLPIGTAVSPHDLVSENDVIYCENTKNNCCSEIFLEHLYFKGSVTYLSAFNRAIKKIKNTKNQKDAILVMQSFHCDFGI